jgi:hypothetical protein
MNYHSLNFKFARGFLDNCRPSLYSPFSDSYITCPPFYEACEPLYRGKGIVLPHNCELVQKHQEIRRSIGWKDPAPRTQEEIDAALEEFREIFRQEKIAVLLRRKSDVREVQKIPDIAVEYQRDRKMRQQEITEWRKHYLNGRLERRYSNPPVSPREQQQNVDALVERLKRVRQAGTNKDGN